MDNISLEKFLNVNFLGGTLVEHKDGTGFGLEFSRGKIEKFCASENILSILTDEKNAFLELDLRFTEDISIFYDNKIYYLNIPLLFNYSIAPKDVVIPRKFNYKEAINFYMN